ncbi:MAG: DUF1835 domain-containing protein [Algoriphagus sp.]|nr:DUF1835 domain-containing protein [Algoriphagus sp.]
MIHILNGDSLANQFPQSIPGEKIIVREALIDGPVKADSLDEFWEIRSRFINENYPDASDLDYFKLSVPEFEKILHLPADSKIYCWFEEDLFCQVNLWFVLNLLKNHPGDVFLVLPYPDSPYHFSSLDEQDLVDSFESKAHFLSRTEREILETLWRHFQNEEIFEALQIGQLFNERFPFLKQAIEAWRDMIPVGDFPGKPKATLLEIRDELQTSEFEPIFIEFQKRLPIYGFGDLQVKRLLREIKKA